jgi:tetratricopeptide (TPR) repeat protein
VKTRLGPGAKAAQARAQTTNLEAYRWYLKGRHLRHAKEDHGGAMRAFEEAVRLDPGHAPSWTGLAESTLISAFSVISGRDACARARQALATAVALEGESADSLDGEALVAMLERRWPAMEATWRRALELQPDHVRVLGSFGVSLCFCGKREEGLRLLARAHELDPLASFPFMLTGHAMLHDRRPQDALQSLDDALSFEREDLSALQASCVAHIALGHFEEGLEAIQRAVDVTGRAPHFLGVLGWALAMAGRTDEARALLAELQARPPEAPSLVSEAWLLGALGQIDEAFDVLARAEAELHPLLCFNGFPSFDPLRSDPRFAALLTRLGLTA